MLKITGAVFVICAATLMGWRMAANLDRAYDQMSDLIRIIHTLQGEIRYARTHIGEALCRIAQSEPEPYRSWMAKLSRKLSERRGGSLPELWEGSAEQLTLSLDIPDKEKKRFAMLGQYLGSGDTDMQLKQLELYAEQLKNAKEEMGKALAARKKLYRALGAAFGVFLAILLI